MNKLNLYQYAVIWHPTEEEAKQGKKSKIVINIATDLAASPESAGLLAATKIPDEYKDSLDQIDVVVRPF